MKERKAVPVLFLDLDGTVRKGFDELGRFVNKAEDVDVFPDVPGILAEYKARGWRIVAITNQGGVSMGHLTAEDCRDALHATNQQCDELFDYMAACSHHPLAPDASQRFCWCRKPGVGMIIGAVKELADVRLDETFPPNLAWMIGDRVEDAECARNAGIRFMPASEWRAGQWKEPLGL